MGRLEIQFTYELSNRKEDKQVIKFVCADVDKSGKDARGAADAIKKSIERRLNALDLLASTRSRKNISVLTLEGGWSLKSQTQAKREWYNAQTR